MRKAILERIKTDSNFSTYLLKSIHRIGKQLETAVERCYLSNSTFFSAKVLKNFFEAYKKLNPALPIGTALGRDVLTLLKQNLKKKFRSYSEEKIEKMISILTFPDYSTPFYEEQKSLLEIGAKVQKSAKEKNIHPLKLLKEKWVQKNIDKHCQKFNWIPVNFVDAPWTKEDFEKRLKELLKKTDCRKEIFKRIQNRNQMIKERDSLIEKLKLSSQTKRYIKILQAATYFNEYRKSIFCKANLRIRPFLNKIGKKFGLQNWLECSYLLPNEILNYLKSEKIDKMKIKHLVNQRMKKY
jgi:hypothetical protein